METKICSCCGKEFPITHFRSGVAHGKPFVLSICQSCMSEKLKMGHKKKKEKKENDEKLELKNTIKELREGLEKIKSQRLSSFTPRELMKELASRGYQGKLTFTEIHEVDITNF